MRRRQGSPEFPDFVVRRGERDVELRRNAEDIGAVEVQIGDVWCAVAAVHAGFEGKHAQV